MQKKGKPDLSTGGGGAVDPEFIPKTLRDELLLHLEKSSLSTKQQHDLIKFANDYGQFLFKREVATGKSQRNQIDVVRANTRRLMASIRAMSRPAREALQAHTDYLVLANEPPVTLDWRVKRSLAINSATSLLDEVWDWASALELSAGYTLDQFNIDKQSKPEEMRTRGFVVMLADQVWKMTGVLPPKDRSAWFAIFSSTLTAYLGLEAGPRMVASAIKKHADVIK